jgi:cyclopropane fatty-acyl-phospholipid synthase-like methyltransferase
MGPAYRYDSDFFDFVDVSSGRSAARFIERLELGFLPRTLLDVGCGRGVWLRAWKQRGVALTAARGWSNATQVKHRLARTARAS